ncbi:MAG: hypothetical protein AAGA68_27270 [Pseudomonadota bacterium]
MPAAAMIFPDFNVRQLQSIAQRADLVFVGTVTKIEYAQSAPSIGAPRGAPHTYVTYHVEKTLSGEADGRHVTLRFLGGPLADGRITYADGFPLFDLGDRDLLFVAGNGRALCPLVQCSGGRFRLVDGYVYSEEGRVIELNRRGELRDKGPQLLLEAVTNRVGDHTLSRVEVLTEGDSDLASRRELARSLEVSELMAALSHALGPERQRSGAFPFHSADADDTFTIDGLAAVDAPDDPAEHPVLPSSDQDLRELAALRTNRGNPVLPSHAHEAHHDASPDHQEEAP